MLFHLILLLFIWKYRYIFYLLFNELFYLLYLQIFIMILIFDYFEQSDILFIEFRKQ